MTTFGRKVFCWGDVRGKYFKIPGMIFWVKTLVLSHEMAMGNIFFCIEVTFLFVNKKMFLQYSVYIVVYTARHERIK